MRSFVRALIFVVPLLVANGAFAQGQPLACDVDIDSDVDINDIRAIIAARNTPASGPDDPRDVDGDGVITVLDARQCVLRCTLPGCAEPQPNQAPTISSIPPLNATEGELYTYDIEANDADGDTLTYSLDVAPDGMTIDPATGLVQWTPDSSQIGANIVGVRVSDPSNAFASQAFSVDVAVGNVAPTITSVPPLNATEGELYTYDVEANDADGDTLTYTLDVAPTGMTIDPATGLVQWTPDSSQIGANIVGVRVTDPSNAFASQAFSVDVAIGNVAPTITSVPPLNAIEGELYTYDVEANDADGDTLTFSLDVAPAGMTIDPATGLVQWTPDSSQIGANIVGVRVSDPSNAFASQAFSVDVAVGNVAPTITSVPPLNATEGELYTYDVEANDADGDTLTYTLDVAPTGMTIDPATGLVQWTPDSSQIGANIVGVRVTDPSNAFASQAFSVDVAAGNQAPVITSMPVTTGTEGQLYTYDVEAIDPDGDTLTFALNTAPAGMTIDPVTGLIQWTPAAAQTGLNTVAVQASDPGGLSDTQTYAIDVAAGNQAPVITSTPVTTGTEGQLYTYDVEAIDPDGDALTFALNAAPAGMTIDPVTGLIQWTPAAAQTGLNTVAVQVADPGGLSDTQTYAIDVAAGNQAPVITSTPVTTGTEGQLYTYDVEAIDPDGDALTFSLDAAPVGMTIDPVTGLIQWTPAAAQIGANTVAVRVADPGALSDTQTYAIDVAAGNQAPVITSTPVTTGTEGQLYTYDVEAIDPDGDALTFSLDAAPVGMTIDPVTGLIQWTPAAAQIGANTVAVRVADPGALSDTQTYAIDVVAADADFLRPEVTLTVAPGPNANINDILTLQVTATDDTAVAFTALNIDGAPVPLDPAGTATFTSATAGIFDVLATAVDSSGNEGAATATLRFLEVGDVTPPTAAISAPANDAPISTPIDVIGTATDESSLLQYRILASRSGRNDFSIIDTGDVPVINDVLGEFDPSLLENGLYDLRLDVEDTAGNTSSVQTTVQVEGNLKVGNFSLTITDLEIPVAGIPITINRNYDTRRKTSGDFGSGWALEIDGFEIDENRVPGSGWEIVCIREIFGTCIEWSVDPSLDHLVVVTRPNGRQDEFLFDDITTFAQPNGLAQGTIVTNPLPGTAATLQPLDDTFFDFLLGGELQDILLNTLDPNRYRLTGTDGTTIDLNQINGIERIIDRNGNVITFASGGIIHSAGASVLFTRDAEDRITSITDPLGNVLTYEYDVYGDLVASTDAEGNTTRYLYNNDHGLLEIIDPLGRGVARNEYDDDGRLIATVDADGNRVEYTRDIDARQEVVTDRLGNVTVFGYDDQGNITAQTDALGNTTAFTYDANGNQLTLTDPLGNTTARSFDAADNPLSETDPLGNTTTLTYNAAGDPLTITEPRGNTITRTYDANGNLLAETDASGGVTTNTFDASGNVLSTTDANGNVAAFTYDARGNETSTTDPLGNVATYTYDANGNQITESRVRSLPAGGTETQVTTHEYDGLNRLIREIDPLGNLRDTIYDPNGNVAAEVDALGRAINYAYDARGNRVQTTYPDGTTQTSVYDAENRPITSTDRAGRTTSLEYDALGRLTRTTYPDGSAIQQAYDAAGRRVGSTDENGNVTTYEYDAAGRVVQTVDALGNVVTFAYDAAGNQTSTTDPLGNVTTFTYDANDQLTVTTFPDGTTGTVTNDAVGRRIAETDQLGQTTTFTYDAGGRLLTTTDALGNVTTSSYDELGNRLTQVDANGNTESWTYDALGRVLTHTLPLGQSEAFTYDAAGNVLTHQDFNGDTTTYVYDVNDRLISQTFADASIETFTYFPSGLIAAATDARGTTQFQYDLRDRLMQKILPDGEVLSYTYDAAGNRLAVTSAAGTTTSTYDALNRLSTVTDGGGASAYTYDAVGNRATLTYPNGNVARYTYDAVNRLTNLENETGAGAVLSSYAYTLAADGKRTGVVEADGRQVDYVYDAVNRLVQETITDPGPIVTVVDYTYDAVGNRLTRNAGGAATAYAYDANDRLLSDDASTYTYDDNGNLLTRTSGAAVTTYSWSFENELIAVSAPLETTEFEYDELGNRVIRRINGITSRFIVDTNRQLPRVVAELDAAGAAIVAYTVGDDLINQTRAGADSYYLYDGNASTRQLSDGTGAISDEFDYDAFGNLLARTGTTDNEFLYVGEQLDANIGFYYLRARYMDPSAGRFISRDPFAGNSFDPPSLHKYSYALNNPTNVTDPTGQFGIASIGFNFSIRSILISAAISAPFRALEAAKDLAEGASLGAVTVNLVSGIGFDVAVGGAIGNLFRFARSLVSVRAISQSISAFRAARAPGSIWNLGPFARGWAVETRILGNRWLAANFPVIDDFVRARGIATSLKSLDLTAASYQTASRLRSAITRSARSLANFNGATFGGVTIAATDIRKRVLVYAFESGAVTRQQARILREVARELKRDLNIDLVFQWLP